MLTKLKLFVRLTVLGFLLTTVVRAQDASSLGDLARQQRQQRDQAASQNSSKEPKVITNEEIPEHTEDEGPAANRGKDGTPAAARSKTPKQTAEYWKSRIQAQKSQISALQQRMAEINSSIRFSSFNCGANCAVRDERQRSKQQQVEQIQSQIEQQKKRLEEMQESARKQGYGSSVYDP